jgi:hypothetical protein
MSGTVTAMSQSPTHTFTKQKQASIRFLPGLGIEGDVHQGKTVKHRSRVARDPSQPNLRQVHLIHAELHDELQMAGFPVSGGQVQEIAMGDNDLPVLDAFGLTSGLDDFGTALNAFDAGSGDLVKAGFFEQFVEQVMAPQISPATHIEHPAQ